MNAPMEPFEDVSSWGYSVDAEQSVLGGLLLDNSAYDRVCGVVRDSDFFVTAHREIFRAIFGLIEAGKPADVLTVSDRLQALGKLEAVGGQAFIGSLSVNTPSAANVARYAEMVAERATLRGLFAVARSIGESVRLPGGRSARELLDAAQASVMAIRDSLKSGRGDFHSAGSVVNEVVSFVDEQHQKYLAGTLDFVTGLPTGFTDLDRRTTGLHPGQLVIVAARPGMGKSALALNVTEYASKASGKTALVFSLEMSLRELGLRMVASGAGINVQRLVTGRVNDAEWSRVANAMVSAQDLPIVFCEVGGLSVLELRTMARQAKREFGGLSLIVVDYLQLMIGGASEQNRAAEISVITRNLKLLAKELQIPVIALSQLNRDLEKRSNKRPVMSDLRDSGSIEQDADLIWFIYRDEVYNPNSDDRGYAEVITGKQRNGPTGVDRLAFRGDFTRFANDTGQS